MLIHGSREYPTGQVAYRAAQSLFCRAIVRLVRVRPLFAALLLAVCVGAPVLEMFDRWDHTLQDGNDTESNLVVVALCVGVGLIAATALLRRVRPSWTGGFILRSLASPPISYSERRSLLPGFVVSSPPPTLRI
jgi:hypothetical protein